MVSVIDGQCNCEQVTADDVQDILLWEDTWASAKIFSIGLYALICLRALVMGETYFLVIC